MNEQPQTLQQLQNWIKCYLIPDVELKSLPAQLVAELGRRYRARWVVLNRGYYDQTSHPSSASTTR